MVQVDMTKLVGVNLASSHTYQDQRGMYYSMGTSLLSGPKYHIIRTAAVPSGKAQDGERALCFSSASSLLHLSAYFLLVRKKLRLM
jgi:hypothetical protein